MGRWGLHEKGCGSMRSFVLGKDRVKDLGDKVNRGRGRACLKSSHLDTISGPQLTEGLSRFPPFGPWGWLCYNYSRLLWFLGYLSHDEGKNQPNPEPLTCLYVPSQGMRSRVLQFDWSAKHYPVNGGLGALDITEHHFGHQHSMADTGDVMIRLRNHKVPLLTLLWGWFCGG